jgi:putative transposase
MPNTYTQLSVHAVFAVKHRENFITQEWRNPLHEYISGIITREKCKSLAVGGWKDHVHIFFGLHPTLSVSELLQSVKSNSSRWVNDNRFLKGRFHWQEGYAAFSYARSQRDAVVKYITNQEAHHKTKSFRQEYLSMLEDFEVSFEERFLPEFYD